VQEGALRKLVVASLWDSDFWSPSHEHRMAGRAKWNDRSGSVFSVTAFLDQLWEGKAGSVVGGVGDRTRAGFGNDLFVLGVHH